MDHIHEFGMEQEGRVTANVLGIGISVLPGGVELNRYDVSE